MLLNQKSALMFIHKQLVKQGYLFLAQMLLHHLTGTNKNLEVANFLLSLYNSEI